MMTKTFFISITAILLLTSMEFTNSEKDIVGNWKAKDIENATIQVYKAKNGFFYGKIIECDRKEWIGEIILKEVKYIPDHNEWKGEIYSLERDATISVLITLIDDKKMKLVGRKYLFTKTLYWSR